MGEDEWNKLSDQEKQRKIVELLIGALIQHNLNASELFIIGPDTE